MIVCKEYEARISALIDDELTIEERIEVLEHLDRCPACRAYWEDLLAMRDVLRAEETPAPAGFADAVMARVHVTEQEKAPEKKILRFPQWRRYAALAACFAVVLVGIWSMDLLPAPEHSMDQATTNNCAAPERSAQEDTMTGAMMDGDFNGGGESKDYGLWADGTDSASCEASEKPDSAPKDDTAENSIRAFAQNGNFTAAVVTASDVAGEWVEENLGKAWIGGTVYSLNEHQYNELRGLLEDAGEEFTEIMGEITGSEYCLLAE